MFIKSNSGNSIKSLLHSPNSASLSGVKNHLAKTLCAIAFFGTTAFVSASGNTSAAPASVSSTQSTSEAKISVYSTSCGKIVLNYYLADSFENGTILCYSEKSLAQYGQPDDNRNFIESRTVSKGSGSVTFDTKEWATGIYYFFLYGSNTAVSAVQYIVANVSQKIDNHPGIVSAYILNDRLSVECWIKDGDKANLIFAQGNNYRSKSINSNNKVWDLDLSKFTPGDYTLDLLVNSTSVEKRSLKIDPRLSVSTDDWRNRVSLTYDFNPNKETKVEFYNRTTKKVVSSFTKSTTPYKSTKNIDCSTWPAGDYYAFVYEGTARLLIKPFTINPVGNAAKIELTNDTENTTVNFKLKLPSNQTDGTWSIVRKSDVIANNFDFWATPCITRSTVYGNVTEDSYNYEYMSSGEYWVCLFGANQRYPYATAAFTYSGYDADPIVYMSYDSSKKRITAEYEISNGVENAEIRFVRIPDDELNKNFDNDELMAMSPVKTITINGYQPHYGTVDFSTSSWANGHYLCLVVEDGVLEYIDEFVIGDPATIKSNPGVTRIEKVTYYPGNSLCFEVDYFVNIANANVSLQIVYLGMTPTGTGTVILSSKSDKVSTKYLNTVNYVFNGTAEAGYYSVVLIVNGRKYIYPQKFFYAK